MGPSGDHGYGGIELLDDGRVAVGGFAMSGSADFAAMVFDAETINNWQAGIADWGNGSNAFSACLHQLGGGALIGSWPIAGAGNCAVSAPANWRSVPATASLASHIATSPLGTTTARADLRFGLRTSVSQPPGRYIAPVTFDVVAPAV